MEKTNNIYLHTEDHKCPSGWLANYLDFRTIFTTSRGTYQVRYCPHCTLKANRVINFIKDIDPVLEHARSIERYIRRERRHMEHTFDFRKPAAKEKWHAFCLFRRRHEYMSSQLTNYIIEELGEYLFYQWERGLRLKGVKS